QSRFDVLLALSSVLGVAGVELGVLWGIGQNTNRIGQIACRKRTHIRTEISRLHYTGSAPGQYAVAQFRELICDTRDKPVVLTCSVLDVSAHNSDDFARLGRLPFSRIYEV